MSADSVYSADKWPVGECAVKQAAKKIAPKSAVMVESSTLMETSLESQRTMRR